MTKVGQRGQLVIPKAIRMSRKILPGDNFEVIVDEDDFDLILLRRIRPSANAGLIKHLASAPWPGKWPTPKRRREPTPRPTVLSLR